MADIIHTDLVDLPLVMGLKEAAPYDQGVRTIRDRYFQVPYLENPNAWLPNEYAQGLTKDQIIKELQRQVKLKRRVESEEVRPEESRRAKRKEKCAKVASMAEEKNAEIKRRVESEEVRPEESRNAKRKEKRAKVASMAEEKDEELRRLKLVAPGMVDASTQTEDINSALGFYQLSLTYP